MNKKIAAIAMIASATSAFALIGPGTGGTPVKMKNYCLHLSEDNKGNAYVGDCDMSLINKARKLPLNENGCADGQASMQTIRVDIKACPTFVQL